MQTNLIARVSNTINKIDFNSIIKFRWVIQNEEK